MDTKTSYDEESNPRANSVKNLSELYTVVIGVALAIAMTNSIDEKIQAFVPIQLSQLPTLAAFILLVVPFYHGAMRHLFATYVEGGGSTHIKRFGLLLDFFLLFIEGCLFILMASIIAHPTRFLWSALALLVIDSLWGIFAWLLLTGAQSQFAERKWATINLCTSALVIAFLRFCPARLPADGQQVAWITLGILAARTFVDYRWTWDFYFPRA